MSAPADTAATTALSRLEALAVQLRAAGMRTRTDIVVDRLPSLHVQNPEAGAGAPQEMIYSAPRGGGWCYWWSWAEPVVLTDDPVAAAAQIARVLRARD
jgi:hypothetical protein